MTPTVLLLPTKHVFFTLMLTMMVVVVMMMLVATFKVMMTKLMPVDYDSEKSSEKIILFSPICDPNIEKGKGGI